MKSYTNLSIKKWILFAGISIFIFSACQKLIDQLPINGGHDHLRQTNTYSSDVVTKWMAMQLRLTQATTGANPFGYNPTRYFAYNGIALYESVVPGMPAYKTLSGQLTHLPSMPDIHHGLAYHWPTCANAALAYMNKNFSSGTSDANKASMDSLENALNTDYQSEVNTEEFQRSVDFGKAVAQVVFNWSKTDGSATVYPPYVPPVGPGLWVLHLQPLPQLLFHI